MQLETDEITLGDCLEALNSTEEDFRAFYEERLDPAGIELAVQLRDLFCKLFDLYLADDIDFDEITPTVEAINEIMVDIEPAKKAVRTPTDWREKDIEEFEVTFTKHDRQVTDGEPLWQESRVSLADSRVENLWEALWEIIKQDSENEAVVAECTYCSGLFLQGRSDQKYCGKSCRNMASRERVGG